MILSGGEMEAKAQRSWKYVSLHGDVLVRHLIANK